ncbi:hypothetical protein N7468_009206 [Penicillium chermesinum]|uniref:Uncharacterized protein n=1 Tax=Penicillium chermesinum TaxID=63820 RepID=A0A9W9NHB8_9EURO|nr:uncharacterized protein N7468_009206 [Penicillium chermesinum]KAJ5220002.1 hypothetical protein N7468_009206 [Penicillium chermesinum]KAJ6157459.1 hypothetical protein N7470_005051 [Penicillium chermesinum]
MTAKETSTLPTNLGDPALLEAIDKLFACNVGQYINLPQLVVVGDQSSGKSSVLEGLTKLSFPRDSGLCTRFATQIVFRRDGKLLERQITASIIPGNDTDSKEKQKLEAWQADSLQNLDHEGFTKMMNEAHDTMGLSSMTGDGKPTFSNSVLKLEIAGPNENHLSVIDVPGIFRTPTPGRTTIADRDMVYNMVVQYMRNPRSIILAVVPANVDTATQEIIHLARIEDPLEERTLKILTKPDLVDAGTMNRVIDMIEEGNRHGELGWIVVRNAGQAQLEEPGYDRDLEERMFFQSSPWNSLEEDNCGINSLIERLQHLLSAVVTREYPKVELEIAKALSEAKQALKDLGKERDTSFQQRALVLDVITEFQAVTGYALTAHYGMHDILKQDRTTRLVTIVSNRNARFSDDIATLGHRYQFHTHPSAADNETPGPSFSHEGQRPPKLQFKLKRQATDTSPKEKLEEADESLSNRGSSQSIEPAKKPSVESNRSKVADIQGILPEKIGITYPRQMGIIAWIAELYRDYRGFEIGTYNPILLSALMTEQSVNWTALAQEYISDIITAVHEFIVSVLENICCDKKLSSGIMSLMRADLQQRYKQAVDQFTQVSIYFMFEELIQMDISRQERLEAALESKTKTVPGYGEVISTGDLKIHNNMSNTEHAVQDLHDVLKSYYKVARKRFVDNVCMQAADYCLVTGEQAPMKLFTPSWVNQLSDRQLERLAGESRANQRQRQKLQKKINDLEAGRACLGY